MSKAKEADSQQLSLPGMEAAEELEGVVCLSCETQRFVGISESHQQDVGIRMCRPSVVNCYSVIRK